MNQGKIIYIGDVETAIDIYMDNESCDKISLDLSKQEPPAWLTDPKLKLHAVEFKGKTSTRFDTAEPMLLQMKWENLSDVSNVSLRIEMLNSDGLPLATYQIFDFYSGKKHEFAQATFELDVSPFMDASYKMRYTFFWRDQSGHSVDIGFANGLHFTKSTLNAKQKIVWNIKNWGHLCLPQPSIRSLTRVSEEDGSGERQV